MSFPPVIPFHTVFMDIVLRSVISYPTQPINSRVDTSVTITSIFNGVWSSLRDTFSQVKLHRIHVYVMTGVGVEERGYHALNVAPRSEYQITEKTTFSTLMAIPGTKMARVTRTVSGVWFPTEPSEKGWNLTAAKSSLMEFVYMSKDMVSGGTATATYPVEITIDAHVRLRGVSYTKLQDVKATDDLDAEFVLLAT